MIESKLLIQPQKNIWWCEQATGPSYFRETKSGQIEAFITGRDVDGVSRIGRALINILADKSLQVQKIFTEPIFDVGEDGCFDENGVSYPWIIADDDKEYMFSVGWVQGGKNRFQTYLGLAVRTAKNSVFERISRAPIIDRSNEEPFGIGSCCVVRDGKHWSMLYTSFLPWNKNDKVSSAHPHSQPSYNIKMATSQDLLNWKRTNNAILEFDNDEHIHGKPVLFRSQREEWKLYFSARGSAYRIAQAEGRSLYNLKRQENLSFVHADWISQTQEYAFPLRVKNTDYLFFNGNGYGRSGLGYCIL